MYTPFEEHVEKTTGCFRSLPVTARLRSKFFITFGGPQGHGHSVEKRPRVCSRAACASLRSRFRSGRRPRFSSPWVARQGHGDSLPVTARKQSASVARDCSLIITLRLSLLPPVYQAVYDTGQFVSDRGVR